jgi:hypothetical protein
MDGAKVGRIILAGNSLAQPVRNEDDRKPVRFERDPHASPLSSFPLNRTPLCPSLETLRIRRIHLHRPPHLHPRRIHHRPPLHRTPSSRRSRRSRSRRLDLATTTVPEVHVEERGHGWGKGFDDADESVLVRVGRKEVGRGRFGRGVELKVQIANPWAHLGSFLGAGGQALDDIYKYLPSDDRLSIARRTLEWRHVAPTAPDTLCELDGWVDV